MPDAELVPLCFRKSGPSRLAPLIFFARVPLSGGADEEGLGKDFGPSFREFGPRPVAEARKRFTDLRMVNTRSERKRRSYGLGDGEPPERSYLFYFCKGL